MESLLTRHLLDTISWNAASPTNNWKGHRRQILEVLLAEAARLSPDIARLWAKFQEMSSAEELANLFNSPNAWNCLTSVSDISSLNLDSVTHVLERELFVLMQRGRTTAIPDLNSINLENVIWDNIGLYGFDAQHSHINPLVAAIVIDSKTAMAKEIAKRYSSNASPASGENFAAAHLSITNALALIKNVHRNTFEFVIGTTSIIVPIDAGTTAPFDSCSSPDFVGAMGLVNLASTPSTAQIISGIVHEAIHSAFDIAELFAFETIENDADTKLRSPWTGRYLDPNTFVQACYVWYGLINFWVIAVQQGQFSEDGRKQLASCCRGFHSRTRLGPRDPLLPFKPGHFLDDIDARNLLSTIGAWE